MRKVAFVTCNMQFLRIIAEFCCVVATLYMVDAVNAVRMRWTHSTTFTLPTTTIDTSDSGSGSSPTIVSISEAFVQLLSL